MNSETVRQRVKYVLEHGEPYPTTTPLSKPLAVKLTLLLIALNVTEIIITILHVSV